MATSGNDLAAELGKALRDFKENTGKLMSAVHELGEGENQKLAQAVKKLKETTDSGVDQLTTEVKELEE